MIETNALPAPDWVGRFLDALGKGLPVRKAAAEAGVAIATAYSRRKAHPNFERAWQVVRPSGEPGANGTQGEQRAGEQGAGGQRGGRQRGGEQWGGPRRIGAQRIEQFLEALAETSNVTAAAAAAKVETSAIYKLRRNDGTFAARWYAALAEGYDNLEMELLQHLRSGESADTAAAAVLAKRKFDTATALRCLTAHREAVAREKGRRTLAQEVSTIAEINAKIDALRRQRKESDRAIARARKANAARMKKPDGSA